MDSVTNLSLRSDYTLPLPDGYCWVAEIEPGSVELAQATADAMRRDHTVIWKGHGAISLGKDLEVCIERLRLLDEFLQGINL
jgi:ribulose-5-phosphate 4-epimerase/fuculose-1-phosphate aldolase